MYENMFREVAYYSWKVRSSGGCGSTSGPVGFYSLKSIYISLYRYMLLYMLIHI